MYVGIGCDVRIRGCWFGWCGWVSLLIFVIYLSDHLLSWFIVLSIL
jgi:hypothetical protein